MNLLEEQTDQKLRGGYYTPEAIGKYLWTWISEIEPESILEPAAGDGALIREIQPTWNVKIFAAELYAQEAKKIKVDSQYVDLNLYIGDYYKWEKSKKKRTFDAVISNPPYIRYQYLSNLQREVQSEILIESGLKPNKLINSWASFLISSINHLKEGGRIGVIVPTDLLQVSYAIQVRKFLVEKLDKFYVVTFNNSAFPDTQQDYLLILGEKKKYKDSPLEFKHIVSSDMFNIPDWKDISVTDMPSLNAKKWSALLVNENDRHYIRDLFKTTPNFVDLAKVEVGITTGNNALFSLSKEKVSQLNAEEYSIPLLGRSSSTKGLIFSESEIVRLNDEKKNNWLLVLNNMNDKNLPTELIHYLQEAQKNGKTKGYKLSIREKWWQIPSVWVPDAFLLRRMGKMPKLILNDVRGVSTDTFHRVVFKEGINPVIVLVAFYSSLTRLSLELAGRTFGGGALEVLPGDMSEIHFPEIDYFQNLNTDDVDVQKIFNYFQNGDDVNLTKFVDDFLRRRFKYHFDYERTQAILWRIISERTS